MKIVHWASKIDPKGHVSALCFARPHAIDLSVANYSVYDRSAVSCPKCKKLLRQADAKTEEG